MVMLLIFSNPFTKAAFYFDDAMIYHRGMLQWVMYLVSFGYAIYGVYQCTKIGDLIELRVRLTLYFYVVIGLGTAVFQFFKPEVLIENFGLTICLFLVMLNLQNSSEFLDFVTGVYNKNAFRKVLMTYQSSGQYFSMMVIYLEDLAQLKRVMGVEATDGLMRSVGRYLEEHFEKNVYLLASDLFAVVYYPEDGMQENECRALLEGRFSMPWDEQGSAVHFPIRLMQMDIPVDAQDLDMVYLYTDYLRSSEHSNRGYLKAHAVVLRDHKRSEMILEAIRKALAGDLIEIYYQPIYSVKDGKICRAEALMRLQDEEFGEISPTEAIAIAEQGGLIQRMGEQIFEKICEFMRDTLRLEDQSDADMFHMNLNLSLLQCMKEDMSEKFLQITDRYGVNRNRICYEIKEEATIQLPKLLQRNMRRLYEQGAHFALDNFGKESCHIRNLLEMPFDIIKLDKSLLDAAFMMDDGKLVLLSSIAMAKRLGMRIVAEGVETKEQFEFLRAMGVDDIQGYYVSKPLPAQEFIAYINAFNRGDLLLKSDTFDDFSNRFPHRE